MLGGVVSRASAVVGSLLEDRYDLFYSPGVGCELSLDRKSGDAVISRIDRVGAAAFCGVLGIGDRIVGIDGREILGLHSEVWMPRWLEGDPGDPLWLQAKQSKLGKIRNVCLVRLDPDQLPPLDASTMSGPASLGIKLVVNEDRVEVDEVEEGGAAWLAMLNTYPPPIMKGDVVRNIDGELTSALSIEDAQKKLEGSPYSWVQLALFRKRASQRVHILRLHRLVSGEADAAVDYRVVAERQSSIPPLFRAGRRKAEPCMPPPVGGFDLRTAAAHALMTCDHGESASYLSRQPSFVAASLTAEQRWVAVALSAALLFRLVHIPPSKDSHVNEEAARLWIIHFIGGLSEQLQVPQDKCDVILRTMLHEHADPAVYASFFEPRTPHGAKGGKEAAKAQPAEAATTGEAERDRNGAAEEDEQQSAGGREDQEARKGERAAESEGLDAASAGVGEDGGREQSAAGAEGSEGGRGGRLPQDGKDEEATAERTGETEGGEAGSAQARGDAPGPKDAIAEHGNGGAQWDEEVEERWLVCWAVLSFAVHPQRYDARTRGLVRGLARELNVPWRWMAAAECAFAMELSGSQVAQESANRGSPEPQTTGGGQRLMRYAKIGGAALVGGAVLGMSGGGAAPAVIAGLSLVAGPTTAAAAGGAGMSVAVGMSFGAAGAGLVGYKVARRTGDVQEFEFDLVDSSAGMPVMIGVAGWLDGKADSPWKVWDEALCDVASDGGEALALRWESSHLRHLGAAIYRFIRDQAVSQGVTAAGTAVLGAAFSTLTLPLALVQAAGMIDSAWGLVTQRADRAGELLAETLAQRSQGGGRPVTLVGFGMGARLIFRCLVHLTKMGAAGQGIVETAACLGLPEGVVETDWESAASVCGHRLINGYCESDWVLQLAYRSSSWRLRIAGLQPVQLPAGSPHSHVLHNIDLTGIVEGHWDYRDKLPALMHILGLSSGVALPPPPSRHDSLKASKSETDLQAAAHKQRRSPKGSKGKLHRGASHAGTEARGWLSDEGQAARGLSSDEAVSDEGEQACSAAEARPAEEAEPEEDAASKDGADDDAFQFSDWDGFGSSEDEA